jgi:hypothetical protein
MIIHPALKPDRVSEPVTLNYFYRMIESLAESSGPPSARAIKETMISGRLVVSEHGYLPEKWSRVYKWCYAVTAGKFHYIFDPLIESYHSKWPARPIVNLDSSVACLRRPTGFLADLAKVGALWHHSEFGIVFQKIYLQFRELKPILNQNQKR